jgi:hypothetical protein
LLEAVTGIYTCRKGVIMMSCNLKLFLALLIVEDDAEALLLHCHGFKKGEIGIDQFVAGVEELAGKLSQRARETTDTEKETHFPSVRDEVLDESEIPF